MTTSFSFVDDRPDWMTLQDKAAVFLRAATGPSQQDFLELEWDPAMSIVSHYELEFSNTFLHFLDARQLLSSDGEEESSPFRANLLGQGGYGVVRQVKWLDVNCVRKQFENWQADDVEVKSLKSLQPMHFVMQNARYNSHILMEGMERELEDQIRAKISRTGRAQPFSLPEASDIMLQLASAMWHIQGRNMIYRDLKAGNILVRNCALLPEGYVKVKVTDFGLSRAYLTASNAGAHTLNLGTTRYRALELASWDYTQGVSRNLPFPCNLFRFAVSCFELLTGCWPSSEIQVGSALYKPLYIRSGVRPSLPGDCLGDLRLLIMKCWPAQPKDRLNFAEIGRSLRKFQLQVLGCDAEGHLTRSFPKDSFTMMESILAAQEQRSRKNSSAYGVVEALCACPTYSDLRRAFQGIGMGDSATKANPDAEMHRPLKDQIQIAVAPVVESMTAALLLQGREDRKQRLKLIAKAEQKLSLQKAKVQRLKRRRACRFQPSRRAFATKLSGYKS